jgi:glucan phosphoethanolaminetransferase (alkaline phosphatase superfamily)
MFYLQLLCFIRTGDKLEFSKKLLRTLVKIAIFLVILTTFIAIFARKHSNFFKNSSLSPDYNKT